MAVSQIVSKSPGRPPVVGLVRDSIIARMNREMVPLRRKLLEDLIKDPRRINPVKIARALEAYAKLAYGPGILAASVSGWLSPWAPVVNSDVPRFERPKAVAPWFTPDRVRQLKTEWSSVDIAFHWLNQQVKNFPDRFVNMASASQVKAAAYGAAINQRTLERLNAELLESIQKGEGRDDWRKRMESVIETRKGFDEAIARTATKAAFREGQKDILEDPVMVDVFPYRMYHATRDNRVRKTHKAFDGKVYHKDSDLAKEADKLLGEWNCRCSETTLTADDAHKKGISDGGKNPKGDEDRGRKEGEPPIDPFKTKPPEPILPPTVVPPTPKQVSPPKMVPEILPRKPQEPTKVEPPKPTREETAAKRGAHIDRAVARMTHSVTARAIEKQEARVNKIATHSDSHWAAHKILKEKIAKLGADPQKNKRFEELKAKAEEVRKKATTLTIEMGKQAKRLQRLNDRARAMFVRVAQVDKPKTIDARTQAPAGFTRQGRIDSIKDWLSKVTHAEKADGSKRTVWDNVTINVSGRTKRENAIVPKGVVNITPDTGDATVVHELAHLLERDKGIREEVSRFLKGRTQDTLVSLKSFNSGSASDEFTRVGSESFLKAFGGDKYRAAYAAKHYASGYSEVVSMGVEELYTNPTRFLRNDPEYAKLILRILRGVFDA